MDKPDIESLNKILETHYFFVESKVSHPGKQTMIHTIQNSQFE